MQSHTNSLIVLLSALLISSCGGGGGETNNSQTGASNSGTVSLAEDVPASTKSKITEFVTPTGASADASTQTFSPAEASIIVANDASGQPLLISIDARNGSLSADTTAIALVRIAAGLGWIPSNLTLDQVEQAIKSTVHYDSLVSAIRASHTAGESPSRSRDVIEATWLVVDDIRSTLKHPNSVSSRLGPLATVAIDKVPFYLIDHSPITEQIWIDSINAGGVNLLNRSLLSWHVKSSDTSGATLTEAYANPMEELESLPSNPLSLYFSTPSITFLHTGQSEAYILFEQNNASKQKNALEVARQASFALMSVLVQFAPKGAATAQYDCVQQAFETAVNKNISSLLAYRTGSEAMAYLGTLLEEGKSGMLKCAFSFDPKSIADSVKRKLLESVLKVWSNLNLTAKIVKTGMTGMQLHDYWDRSQLYHVCLSGGKIVPCDSKFEFKTRVVSKIPSGELYSCLPGAVSALSFQLIGSYDRCVADSYVEVYCVGAGCTNRFFFNRDEITQVSVVTRYYTGNNPFNTSCGEGTQTAHQPGATVYTPGSPRWLPVAGPFVGAALNSMNNGVFVRNVNVTLDPAFATNQTISACAVSAASYTVMVRIYDTLMGEYITVPTSLSVP